MMPETVISHTHFNVNPACDRERLLNTPISKGSASYRHDGRIVHPAAPDIRALPAEDDTTMFRSIVIASTLLVVTAANAFAHETKADIDARYQRQLGQIEQGRQSGAITWREGLKLRAEEQAVARREAVMMQDGKLSKKERAELSNLQAKVGADIEEKSTNSWRRPFWLPRVGR